MKLSLLIPVLLSTLAVPAGGQTAKTRGQRPPRAETELIALTEELIAAAGAAGQKGVERFVVEEFALTDSSGRAAGKRTFLEEIEAGRVRLKKGRNFRLSHSGRRAVMSGVRLVSVRRRCERPGGGGLSLSSDAEREKWALLERQLLRRAELVTVLYEVLLAAGINEAELFGEFAAARSKLLNLLRAPPAGSGPQSRAEAEAILHANEVFSSTLSRAFNLARDYPQLHSSAPYLATADEFYRTERRIGDASCEYSEAAGRDTRERVTSDENVALIWGRATGRRAGPAKSAGWRLERIVSEPEPGEVMPSAEAVASDKGIRRTRN